MGVFKFYLRRPLACRAKCGEIICLVLILSNYYYYRNHAIRKFLKAQLNDHIKWSHHSKLKFFETSTDNRIRERLDNLIFYFYFVSTKPMNRASGLVGCIPVMFPRFSLHICHLTLFGCFSRTPSENIFFKHQNSFDQVPLYLYITLSIFDSSERAILVINKSTLSLSINDTDYNKKVE